MSLNLNEFDVYMTLREVAEKSTENKIFYVLYIFFFSNTQRYNNVDIAHTKVIQPIEKFKNAIKA